VERKFPDGMYYGDLVENKKHGNGKMIYISGKIYEGQWKNGKKDGNGKMIYTNGDVYEGEWKNNKRQGNGILIHKDGTEEKGNWENDRLQNEEVKNLNEQKNDVVISEKANASNTIPISEIKYVECPQCKELNPGNLVCCKYCSASLQKKQGNHHTPIPARQVNVNNKKNDSNRNNNTNKDNAFLQCPKCKEINPSNTVCCMYCSSPLPKSQLKSYTPVPVKQINVNKNSRSNSINNSDNNNNRFVQCPRCKELCAFDAFYCKICGAKINK
jgi:uncharacterized C2H2 Zn-finger protein